MKIKELREELGITQAELAEKIGNVQRNISNWENGVSEPDVASILALADAFGVSTDELLGREELSAQRFDSGRGYEIALRASRLTSEQQEALIALLRKFTDT